MMLSQQDQPAAAAPASSTTPASTASEAPAAPALPVVGQAAPLSPELGIPRGKPTLIVFLRACGDPFAEKTFRSLAALSDDRLLQLACVAVSQASSDVTDAWIAEIGGAWDAEVVVDPERALFRRWGLGLNTSWQMWNPRALYTTYALGRDEGIWSRATKSAKAKAADAKAKADAAAAAAAQAPGGRSTSGNRYQMGGAFAVDAAGIVRWVHVAQAADDLIDFEPVLQLFGLPSSASIKRKRAKGLPTPIAVPEGFR